MSEGTTKRFSVDELRERRRRGESQTDVAKLRSMDESQLEARIAADPDWRDVPADWHTKAEAVMPRPKVPVSLRLDADVLEYFRSQGQGWQTRMNAVLRAYTEASRR